MSVSESKPPRYLIKVDHFYCPKDRSAIHPLTIPAGNNYIEIVTSGVVYFTSNGIRRKYTAGAMFWHIGGEETIHETEPRDPYSCYAFHLVGYEPTRKVPRITSWLPLDNAKAFGKECLEAFHNSGTKQVYLADYVYATLLYRATAPQASAILYPRKLSDAQAFIDSSIQNQKEVNVNEVAAFVSISKPYLFALFREYLHCSPYQYILNQRINRAKALLCGEQLPIKMIASLCCFNNLEVFYRQFHNATGITPAEYRRKYIY